MQTRGFYIVEILPSSVTPPLSIPQASHVAEMNPVQPGIAQHSHQPGTFSKALQVTGLH